MYGAPGLESRYNISQYDAARTGFTVTAIANATGLHDINEKRCNFRPKSSLLLFGALVFLVWL